MRTQQYILVLLALCGTCSDRFVSGRVVPVPATAHATARVGLSVAAEAAATASGNSTDSEEAALGSELGVAAHAASGAANATAVATADVNATLPFEDFDSLPFGNSTGNSTGNGTDGGVIDTGVDIESYYTEYGSNDNWEVVRKSLPQNVYYDGGYKGSTIIVDNSLFKGKSNRFLPIDREFRLHTVAHPNIPQKYLDRWTRWYQESGNTQVFRLYKGEVVTKTTKQGKGRVEAASTKEFPNDQSEIWEWSAIITIVKPINGAIFQSFCKPVEWGLHLAVDAKGRFEVVHRRNNKDVFLPGIKTGVPTHFRVRDDGQRYTVYVNGRRFSEGYYDRPRNDVTNFRWGIYVGSNIPDTDGMIWFTGTTVKRVSSL